MHEKNDVRIAGESVVGHLYRRLFRRLSIRSCLSCVHNCDDLSFLIISYAVQMYEFLLLSFIHMQ